ncbi:MAG: prolyl oligopeptidase family serine peptidase, partial [Clostridia bacterium]|nr:prolyl oligopeptidase family serine peptidase [Clostridia bacterium]
NNNNNDDNKSPTAPLLTIVEKGKSDYTLVADEAQGERVISTASSLYNAIKDSTGVALKSNRHGESNEQKEIHLGLTKHPLSVSTYNTLDYDEYSILVIGEKIFIVGGTPSALEAATEEFMNKFANSEEKHIKIPERTDITGKISSLALEKLKSGSWNVFDYGSTNVEYGILLPKNYDATKQYPYFIYVHGHGYGGDNTQGYNWNKFQTYLESLGFLDAEGIRDCIIIAPHLKVNQGKESWWSNSFNVIGYAVTDIPYDTTPPSNNLTDMYTIIRQVGDALNIDENRVYITGASDGGYATWELITRYTDFFTAAIPLCGAADTSKADVIRDLPIFFFHGDADTTVSISAATKIEAALKAAGAKSYNYVALKGLGHGISQAAYSHDGLWDWLFAQTKK